ncbi:unnamed protein product [Closterium sp. NIES-64]|nr:unnamed protein product [Closterium sp. NIES-64]
MAEWPHSPFFPSPRFLLFPPHLLSPRPPRSPLIPPALPSSPPRSPHPPRSPLTPLALPSFFQLSPHLPTPLRRAPLVFLISILATLSIHPALFPPARSSSFPLLTPHFRPPTHH